MIRMLSAAALLATAVTIVMTAASSRSSNGDGRPVELGRIDWSRDFDAATRRSRETGRPLLVLFDEVPGCATCQAFGKGPLSHPIVVDAANNEFVPVVVYNNSDHAAEHALLKRFDEPRWANPAIRILTADGKDVVPPSPGDYTTGVLLARMRDALKASRREIPEYLGLVASEYAPAGRETASFAVSCYWVGEQKLGVAPGVIGTRTGSIGGDEIIELQFDPTQTSLDKLAVQAKGLACYQKTLPAGTKPAALDTSNQQQYHLWLHKPWYYVPLTSLQATRVNAAIVAHESPDRFLSPTQLGIQRELQAIYERDPRKLEDFEKTLKVDRSPEGLIDFARQVERAVR